MLELCHGAVRDIKAYSLGEIKTTMKEYDADDVPDDVDNILMVGSITIFKELAITPL